MNSERLKEYILSSEEVLDTEAIKEVEHYYNQGEYEMAFEGLLIELIQIRKYPKRFIFNDWKELSEVYNIENESVFDESIWPKFLKWGIDYSKQ
ncbi:hypothetical protein [Bacillus sp. OAE603]|uniref:hypothetical protein n=1 Tax=Gottfriedia sp. OAE603 TaxID=2663872 RepID=UPI00178AB94F